MSGSMFEKVRAKARRKTALTETQVQQRIVVAKKVAVGAVALAIPVTIFVLFKQKQNLAKDFSSLYETYYELLDNHMDLIENHKAVSERLLNQFLDTIPPVRVAS